MNKKMIEEAVSLFRHQYGIHPAQSAYPVIDVYEKQHAYLYASSEEAVKAYKTQQNIIRWMMTYFLWLSIRRFFFTPQSDFKNLIIP